MSGGSAVVGEYGEGLFLGDQRGAAYVFEIQESGWSEVKKLTAFDAVSRAEFGQSVASDGTTTAVGAWKMDGQAGAVYVFERNAGGPGPWAEVQKLSTSDADDLDFFGFSVSLSRPFIFGAAHRDDDKGNNAGAAYAFRLVSVSLPSLTGWGLALCTVAMLACAWWSRRTHRE